MNPSPCARIFFRDSRSFFQHLTPPPSQPPGGRSHTATNIIWTPTDVSLPVTDIIWAPTDISWSSSGVCSVWGCLGGSLGQEGGVWHSPSKCL